MSEAMLAVPARMECDCCGTAVEGTWDVPASAFGWRRCPDASSATRTLAEKASGRGWLLRGSAALCPGCLREAVESGGAPLPPPASAAQAIDQLALARAVRKLRREAGEDVRADR
ncbi:MAG: hypothetical protein IJ087_08590 [Eggerthellaceae bacterium]|nr:hypothetical protein [Eggerthellaceae bacterium]